MQQDALRNADGVARNGAWIANASEGIGQRRFSDLAQSGHANASLATQAGHTFVQATSTWASFTNIVPLRLARQAAPVRWDLTLVPVRHSWASLRHQWPTVDLRQVSPQGVSAQRPVEWVASRARLASLAQLHATCGCAVARLPSCAAMPWPTGMSLGPRWQRTFDGLCDGVHAEVKIIQRTIAKIVAALRESCIDRRDEVD